MHQFETLAIFERTLGQQQSDRFQSQRELLRVELRSLRERAELIASRVATDLPNFTDHSVKHLDSLWEYADLLIGDEVELTPCEAFVLGAAFLAHDLGMTVAAYPGGLQELQRTPEWKDAIALYHKRRGRKKLKDADFANPDPQAAEYASQELLRILHAKKCEDILLNPFRLPNIENNDPDVFLIGSDELRTSFATLIGQIAHSHWWNVEDLLPEFTATIRAPGQFPKEWNIDPLKLACILRIADFSHLDARRANKLAWAIQQPSIESAKHWKFQQLLTPPELASQKLSYRSTADFLPSDSASWWLCFETLQSLDREIQQVNELLATSGRKPLVATGVYNVDTPEKFANSVRTKGWFPFDVSVTVSSVSNLVQLLGGEKLYGENWVVPLRELIQNSADAVRARRYLENRCSDWGEITVEFGRDDEGIWLEVSDTGIGMSRSSIKNGLLNFGQTFWSTPESVREFPGLVSTDFRPTGKYGIGFFSVFMWGQRVQVKTRRFDAAKSECLILEFANGLHSRPLLRLAKAEEQIKDGGTSIRIWLDERLSRAAVLGEGDGDELYRLRERCVSIAPCLDVNVKAKFKEDVVTAVEANDWLRISDDKLLDRVKGAAFGKRGVATIGSYKVLPAPPLRAIADSDGEILGRAAIWGERLSSIFGEANGLVMVGGISAVKLKSIVGVIGGESLTASRGEARISIPNDALVSWATAEGRTRLEENHSVEFLREVASVLVHFNCDVSSFPLFRTSDGWINLNSVCEIAATSERLTVGDVLNFPWNGSVSSEFSQYNIMFFTQFGNFWCDEGLGTPECQIFELARDPSDMLDEPYRGHIPYLFVQVINKIADVWGCSPHLVAKLCRVEFVELPKVASQLRREIEFRASMIKVYTFSRPTCPKNQS